MAYVDGFVLPIAKKNLTAYRKLARKASRIWLEHGALEYREAAGDDLDVPFGTPFPKLARCKTGETVVFAWIVYKSRAHRDRVNRKVMADERLRAMCNKDNAPFDMTRMSCGGFKLFVDA